MTSLSRVLNKGVSRSPIRTQRYGILDMSQNNGCSRRENTHTKPNKQTKNKHYKKHKRIQYDYKRRRLAWIENKDTDNNFFTKMRLKSQELYIVQQK